jgi:hypothetical protein
VLKLFLFLLFIQSVSATSFRPQPIEQQIKESDGIFLGHYLKKKSVKLEDGSLATQMYFKMSKEVGLQSEFFGLDEIIVHYPGGKLGDQHIHVEGVPKFVQGEKVVLFIKNINQRYWGMNLGFGSFKMVNFGKETVLVNTIFPDLPKIGQVKWGDFELAVKSIKGLNLRTIDSFEREQIVPNRLPASEGQNRSLASVSEEAQNNHEAPILNIFWLVVILGIAGGIFRFSVNTSTK